MAHASAQGPRLLNGFKRLSRFDKGLGAELPEAYKKFWFEWKLTQPAAVHFIPKGEQWERDEITGQVKRIQDVPLPLIDPPESHDGIWGGEAVIKGFQKRDPLKRRVPHFWVPVLRRSVVHSKVLDEYMAMVVTERTLDRIHDCLGFDHYLLKNPACDLRSSLALKLKRRILQQLLQGCPIHDKDAERQKLIYNEYKCYLDAYTPEEIDWYGYPYIEAIRKLLKQKREENPTVAHKVQYRMKLIDQLKQAGIAAANSNKNETSSNGELDLNNLTKIETTSTPDGSKWISKINPFGKKQET